ETGRLALEEVEEGKRLLAAFDLAARELACVCAVDGAAVGRLYLRDVHPPFARVLLRTKDRALARETCAAFLRLLHQRRHRSPRFSGAFRIDLVQAEH